MILRNLIITVLLSSFLGCLPKAEKIISKEANNSKVKPIEKPTVNIDSGSSEADNPNADSIQGTEISEELSEEIDIDIVDLDNVGNQNFNEIGNGNTYWVDINNQDSSDDSQGTKERPWRTLLKANLVAEAGDTVIVMPGIYIDTTEQNEGSSFTSFVPKNSGEEGNPITFKSFIPRTAILKSNAPDTDKAYRYKALAFYTKHDIVYDGFKTIGMVHFLGSQRISFINGEVTHGSLAWGDPSLLWGIAVERSSHCTIRNNKIHSMAQAIKNGSPYMSHNQAGIMVFGGGDAANTSAAGATAFSNLIDYNTLDMGGVVYAGLGNKGGALNNNVWRNNFVKNAQAGILSIGATDGSKKVYNSVYSNNILVNNKFAVEFDNRTIDAQVSNNTFIRNDIGIKLVQLNSLGIKFFNNIVYDSSYFIYADAYHSSEVNSFIDLFTKTEKNNFSLIDSYAKKEKSPTVLLTQLSELKDGGFHSSNSEDTLSFVNVNGTDVNDFKLSQISDIGALTIDQDIVGAYW